MVFTNYILVPEANEAKKTENKLENVKTKKEKKNRSH